MKFLLKITLLTSVVYLVGCAGGSTDDAGNTNNINTESKETTTPPTQVEEQPSTTTQPQTRQTETDGTDTQNSDVALNPPHGQPGHECGIPVGEPLNSANSNNATGPERTNASGPERTNASGPENTNIGGSAAEGTNPPHGEPGHECGIPVGAPLEDS